MARLHGKRVLVTGAARGQGAAVARRFVAEGAKVLIADVLDEQGRALADELGDAARYQHLDVTAEDDWTVAIEQMQESFSGLDVLVNNAGVLFFSALEQTSLADYERVVRINQFGCFLGMRAAVEPMKAAGGGSIVNTSSIEGLGGMPYLAAYTASKFAIRGMTKSAAMELGQYGIRVNSVHPGMIDTAMVAEALGGNEPPTEWLKQRLPIGRQGSADEIASMILFVASDESSYSTGAEFVADGGATATHALKL
ncbi:glucose 1-dehydrogenase [Tsukamurella serpentis]